MQSFRIILALSALLVLAACESDEERAARHFASGVELAEAGDVDRAIVEFRNVLSYDENHLEARLLFARLSREKGSIRQSIENYLRVAETDPEVLEAQLALAELAVAGQDWEAAERHGRAALKLAPEDIGVQAINTILDYRDALIAGDDSARSEAFVRAEALIADRPDDVPLRNVLIDGLNWQGDTPGALAQTEVAIETAPDLLPLYFTKLSLLSEVGDEPAIEAHLRAMVVQFPDNAEIKGVLIRYFLSTSDFDKAEEFFREFVDPNAEDVGPYVAFVRFLAEARGPEAAIAELDRTAEGSGNSAILRSLRAGMRFDLGERDAAIREMEEVLAAEPPVALAGDLRVALARMLVSTGNEVGARSEVEKVLAVDPGNGEALKLQARWMIEADEADEAVNVLRQLITESPEDIEAIDLLATAYARAGNHSLSRDMMALAVSTSNNAPGPVLRYAAVLIERGSLRPAESILVDALRQAPENVDLLAQLGELYLREGDYSRSGGVVDRLDSLGDERATAIASNMRAAVLAGQRRTDELVALLEDQAASAEDGSRARALLIRTKLANGDLDGALAAAEAGVAESPDDPDARLALAATRAATGDIDGAIADYRAMIDNGAPDGRAHRLLTAALVRQGDVDGARSILAAGLDAFPDDVEMLWMRASLLEQEGDIDGAIAVYETLYETNSGSPVIANNLASLLATWRSDDPASVERAHAIARRLSDTNIPAFQDTYGWVLHLRGDSEAALAYLRPAAAALTGDALVQYHLGMALVAAGQDEAAVEQLRIALDIAGPDDDRPQFALARSELERLAR